MYKNYYPQQNIVTSAARTATGNSGDLTAPPNCNARFLNSISAASGTSPTLTLTIYGRLKSTAIVYLIATVSITSLTTCSLIIENMPETYLIIWTIGGTTPIFTFEVDVQFQEQ